MTAEMRYAYSSQKSSAERRGVDWEFCYEEWAAVWISSGKWSQRGRGSDKYCMARKNDSGPYSTANVYITTNRENSEDFHKWTPEFIKERDGNGRFSGFQKKAKEKRVVPDPHDSLMFLKSLQWSDKYIVESLAVEISVSQLARIRQKKCTPRDDIAMAIIRRTEKVKSYIRRYHT